MAKKRRLASDSVVFFIRITWIVCFMVGAIVLYSAFKREEQPYNKLFAEQEKKFEFKAIHVTCSTKYIQDVSNYPGCKPKRCGRYVMDNVVNVAEIEIMLNLVKRGLAYGGSSGGASILDLHTGAMSKGVHFVNLYKLQSPNKLFEHSELQTYRKVREKIHNALASKFGIDAKKVYLTKPTFFSRLTNKPPLSSNDEYWHPHADKTEEISVFQQEGGADDSKFGFLIFNIASVIPFLQLETYPSFHYTTLLYLSDYGIDFYGGQFNFLDKGNFTSTVQPKKGRVLLFTSGHENTHFVERVTQGVRFAITISFTCDAAEAIPDPFTSS